MDMSTILAVVGKYARPANAVEVPYGTAGFRKDASEMNHIVLRCGLVSVLRSLSCENLVVGVCITASHNPAKDNGVKLIDSSGGMLCKEFEAVASNLVNTHEPVGNFMEVVAKYSKEPHDLQKCKVFIGSDTRPSSPLLMSILEEAISATGAQVVNYGLVTTPQLHWLVYTANFLKCNPTLEMYEAYFNEKFGAFVSAAKLTGGAKSRLVVDGSNGVGGVLGRGSYPAKSLSAINVDLEMRNYEGELNSLCGADFVQKKLQYPLNFTDTTAWMKCASLDGDSDRLVYFTADAEGKFTLIDGDKIAILYCAALRSFLLKIQEEARRGGQQASTNENKKCQLKVGVVQTAFANGASTLYLDEVAAAVNKDGGDMVKFTVDCAKTGVKFVHAKAEAFDIGVYFESNGHGTILVRRQALADWAQDHSCTDTEGFRLLTSFLDILNPVTGDAFSDLLAAEAALKYLSLDMKSWSEVYTSFPSVQLSIPVPRSILDLLKPNQEHEKYLESPLDLQKKIDDAVKKIPKSRAFCRASGTEDIARIYVEAPTETELQSLSEAVEGAVTAWLAAQ